MLGTCYSAKNCNSDTASLVSKLLVFFHVISAKNSRLLGSFVTG